MTFGSLFWVLEPICARRAGGSLLIAMSCGSADWCYARSGTDPQYPSVGKHGHTWVRPSISTTPPAADDISSLATESSDWSLPSSPLPETTIGGHIPTEAADTSSEPIIAWKTECGKKYHTSSDCMALHSSGGRRPTLKIRVDFFVKKVQWCKLCSMHLANSPRS